MYIILYYTTIADTKQYILHYFFWLERQFLENIDKYQQTAYTHLITFHHTQICKPDF